MLVLIGGPILFWRAAATSGVAMPTPSSATRQSVHPSEICLDLAMVGTSTKAEPMEVEPLPGDRNLREVSFAYVRKDWARIRVDPTEVAFAIGFHACI